MFGKFNAANRRLNKFNRTRGGLSKIIKIMGVTAVFIFGVGLAIALGEDDQVGGSDAKGTQFIKRVDVDEPLPETNPDGTINGLNLLLIDKMEKGYAREYLELARENHEGKLNSYPAHTTVDSVIATNITESGFYPGTVFPTGALPFKDGKIVWNESYQGLPAEAMTLREANRQVFSSNHGYGIGNVVPYYDKMVGGTYGAFQVTPSQFFATEKSNMNGYKESDNRKIDFMYFPDLLTHLDSRISIMVDMMDWDNLTEDEKVLSYSFDYNPGIGAFQTDELGGNPYKSENATKMLRTISEDLLTVFNKYGVEIGKRSDFGQQTFHMTVAYALVQECGWKFQAGNTHDVINNGRDAWNLLKEKSNVTGTLESFVLSNTAEFTLYNKQGFDRNARSGGGICKVTDIGMIKSDTIAIGHAYANAMVGKTVYARMLQASGLADIDPSNPDTYMNKFENEWVPDGTADWMREYGVDPSKVNPKRVALLNEAYKLIGTPYVYGARRPPVKNPDGSYDVKTGAFDCSSLVQYIYNTVHGIEIGSWTGEQINHKSSEEIPLSEAQPGDLVYFTSPGDSTPHHVVMYISGDLTTGGEFTYIHEPNPQRACEISTWAYAGEKRTLRRVKGID